MNKKTSLIIIIILCIVTIPFIYLNLLKSAHNKTIWDAEPRVHWGAFSLTCWGLNGYREGVPNGAWMPSADALNEAYLKNTSKFVRDNLVTIYVNDYNNTIFVVLKSIDTEVTEGVLEIMNPPQDVSVKFRKGPASRDELDNWGQEISSNRELLEEKGVKIKTIIQTANGTLLLGIEDLTKKKLKILTNVLKGKVPLGILEIYRAGPTILDSN